MIYKETLPFIDIFKFTFLDRTELAGKLVPFSLAPCPVASCRLNLLINPTYFKVSQMLVHRSTKQLPYPRFLQRTHCRNECPCLHCGTHLCKKRTATQATFINARSKDKSKGERKMLLAAASDTIRCTKQLTTAFRT